MALRNWATGAERTLGVGVLRVGDGGGGLALSRDGRTVVFATPDPLVRTDTNSTGDVYAWTPTTGALRLISGR